MTASEKARELMIQYFRVDVDRFDDKEMSIKAAKHCCKITIDEIIKTHTHKNIIGLGGYNSEHTINFWNEVKTEVESL